MTRLYKYLLIVILTLHYFDIYYSQDFNLKDSQKDSIALILNSPDDKSIILYNLKSWSSLIYTIDPNLDFQLNYEIEKLCLKALKDSLHKENTPLFKNGLAFAYQGYGIFFDERGNYLKALSYYNKSLAIREQLNDKSGTSSCLNNIGNIYTRQKKYDLALEFHNKSLDLKIELNDSSKIADSYNNIGTIYQYQNKFDKALESYLLALEIRTGIKDNQKLGSSYTNIGEVYFKQGNTAEALNFHTKGLSIEKELNNQYGIANSYYNIASIYLSERKYQKAIFFGDKGLTIAKKINALDYIDGLSEVLYKAYKNKGDYKKALLMHEGFKTTKDSLLKIDARDEINKLIIEERFISEKAKDSIKHASENLLYESNLIAEKQKTKTEKTINIALLIFGFLISIIAIIIAISNKKTKKQKSIITTQHKELDQSHKELNETHKEIKDSINYAKKIQDALLTSELYIKKILPNSFIFYQPKDVVSGDFYWAHKSKKGKLFFTVADCTGHGVPGALMSMIGNSLLNENIIENHLEDTADILNNMRHKITHLLNQEGVENESKDGMHMALCCLDEQTNSLEYSGAFNPLIYISDGELNEIKGDSQPVALYSGNLKPFTKHTIQLKKGDVIYIYSDGFQDQFGGEKDKKYMTKKFKNFLLNISHSSLEEQHATLKNEFDTWKGTNEQVDDVCIMGIKI